MAMSKNTLGTLLLHMVAFLWGFSFIPQKMLVTAGFPPFYTIALRFSFIFLLFIFFRKQIKITKNTLLYGFTLGSMLLFAFATQTIGLQNLDASISAFLTSSSIVAIPILGAIFFKKAITKYNVFAIICTMIGVFIFNFQKGVSFAWSPSILITLLCSLGFTFHIVFSNYFLEKGESPVTLHFLQSMFVSILAWIFALGFETFPTTWNSTTILAILYLGIFASLINYGIQLLGQDLTKDPLKAGLIISLEPAWAFIFAIVTLGETLSIHKMLGILFISCGIIFCEWEAIKKSQLKNQMTEEDYEKTVL